MASTTNKFVQFGCWNQGFCGEGQVNPLTNVMTELREFSRLEKPDFIVVAGDNYYPDKVKDKVTGEKTKTIKPAYLASGFSCLPKDIEIDMILGNHDLEKGIQILEKEGRAIPEEKKECFITNDEVELAFASAAMTKHIDLVVNKARLLGDTLLLLLDTTMYDIKEANDALPCYRRIPGYEGVQSVADLHERQLDFIHESINSFQGKNIILVGHHPITGYKEKEKKDKKKEGKTQDKAQDKAEGKEKKKETEIFLIKAFASFIEVLLNIYKLKTDTVNYYYLCADLHLYQEGTVILPTGGEGNMIIHQYIVGTGGTSLDDNPLDNENFADAAKNTTFETDIKDSEYKGTYNVINSIKVNGFLVCDYSLPTLAFDFLPVPMLSGREGGRRRNNKRSKSKRKTKKRSKKTNKRKSNNKRSNSKRSNSKRSNIKRSNSKRSNSKRSNNKRKTNNHS